MKKLGKLSINPEKLMKDEELINLRGGEFYGDPDACDTCGPGKVVICYEFSIKKTICGGNIHDCTSECDRIFPGSHYCNAQTCF